MKKLTSWPRGDGMNKLITVAAAASLLLASPAHAHETTKERVLREHAERKVQRVAIPAQLRRIAGCESSGRPNGPLNYVAQNKRSTASGAYGVLDGTWRSWARAYGRDVGATRYAKARHAPPSVQDTVATRAYRAHGTSPWRASRRCWK